MTPSAEKAGSPQRLVRRGAARAAILEAGRRVAAREGVAELSLTAVATEAGFGQSTVFGYFRNKDELLLAILADDLAELAALMRDGAAVDRDRSYVDDSGNADVASMSYDTGSTDESYEREVAAPADADVHVVASERRTSLALVREAVFANSEPASSFDGETDEVSREEHSDASRPRVDAWLERRLRVFEHTLSVVERRLKETESSATRSLGLSEDGMKTLLARVEAFEQQQSETVQVLRERLAETEHRQRGVTAEMRAAMNDAATRIEMLESARRADQQRLRDNGATGENEAASAPAEPSQSGQPHAPQEQETYFAAAQRAASAAAVLVEMDRKPAKASPWRGFARRRVLLRRGHYVIAGCAAVLAFVLGAFVAFYVGEARGHELAAALAHPKQTHVAKPRPLHKRPAPVKDASAAPLDRLTALAEAGNPKAELIVGLKYLHGEGTAPDQPMAAQWIRRAAEQHEPMAQYWLASLYEQGNGVVADSAEAVRWYEAAAGQGNRKAMHALGVAYAEGRGTQKDYSEAARWFAKAAALGLVNSEFNLGVLYERGLGVPQSLLDAYKWYAVAAAQGDAESRARIEALKTQLKSDDIAAAERAAENFRPQVADRDANNAPAIADLAGSALAR
jgi:TPR repeat protein/DNA-binding transcriptional regulator YbjK